MITVNQFIVMRRFKELIYLLLVAAFSASCSQDGGDKTPSESVITFIPSISSDTPLSRSAMEAGFNEGDGIGIYMYNGALSTIYATNVWKQNMKLSCASQTSWTLGEEIYWQEIPYQKTTCVAYYPYQSTNNTNNLTSVGIQVATDQSTNTALRDNDFLWTKIDSVNYTSHGQGIPLKMGHLMSKIKVTFTNFGSEISSCSVLGIIVNGSINMISGDVTTNSNSGVRTVKMCFNTDGSYAEAVVLPQTIDAGTFVSFIYNGVGYAYKLDDALQLESGKEYLIKLDGSTL